MSEGNTILFTLFGGVFLENIMFSRGIGMDGIISHANKTDSILAFGTYVYTISIPACALAWLVKNRLLGFSLPLLLEPMIWLLCLSLAYMFNLAVLKLFTLKNIYRDLLPVAAFSCSALGTTLFAFSKEYELILTLIYANGSIVGLMGSMLLVHFGRERVLLSHVPTVFKGLPIILIYAGILSMAIYGLIGYKNPIV